MGKKHDNLSDVTGYTCLHCLDEKHELCTGYFNGNFLCVCTMSEANNLINKQQPFTEESTKHTINALRVVAGLSNLISTEALFQPTTKENEIESTTGNSIDPYGVDHPEHYNMDPSGVECITVIRHRNFNIGNAIKYLWRMGLKGNKDNVDDQIKDMKKAIWYIEDEITRLENKSVGFKLP